MEKPAVGKAQILATCRLLGQTQRSLASPISAWKQQRLYRHTSSLHCPSLCCPLQILWGFFFLQIEGWWQHLPEESLLVPFFQHYLLSNDLQCYCCKEIMTHWRLRWWLALFCNKVFLIKVCTFFRHNGIAHLIDYSVNNFYMHGKPKNKKQMTHFISVFALLWWSGTKLSISPNYASTLHDFLISGYVWEDP